MSPLTQGGTTVRLWLPLVVKLKTESYYHLYFNCHCCTLRWQRRRNTAGDCKQTKHSSVTASATFWNARDVSSPYFVRKYSQSPMSVCRPIWSRDLLSGTHSITPHCNKNDPPPPRYHNYSILCGSIHVLKKKRFPCFTTTTSFVRMRIHETILYIQKNAEEGRKVVPSGTTFG